MGFEDQMAEYDQDFQDAARRSGTLDDGNYVARITEMRVQEDEDNNDFTIVVRFEDEGGAGSIRKWWNRLGDPDNADGRSYCAQDMKRLGYEGKLSELKKWIEDENPIDLVCEIKVQTKAGKGDRDYTNVYINRVQGKGAPSPQSSQGMADDDIPF